MFGLDDVPRRNRIESEHLVATIQLYISIGHSLRSREINYVGLYCSYLHILEINDKTHKKLTP